MYSDNMIVGNVEFFRNAVYNFVLTPRTVKVAKEVMKNRMRKVLKLFAKEGCETIVLGAFGCGVFANNPVDVATNWVDLLKDEGYYKYFKHILFSIYDKEKEKKNFNTFYNILNNI